MAATGDDLMEVELMGNVEVYHLSTRQTQEKLKDILKKLLQNKLDQFEILSYADKLSVNIRIEERFSKQKFALQKAVLEQILKVESSSYFLQLLDETNRSLQLKRTSKYLCCLVGCLYTGNKHRAYLQHLRKVHSTHSELSCNFRMRCRCQFTSIKLLMNHVKDCHSTAPPVPVPGIVMLDNQACKCDLLACRNMEFISVGKFMTHIINFHAQEERQCIFKDCLTKFSRGSSQSVRNHFLLKHKGTNKLELKLKHKVISQADFMEVNPGAANFVLDDDGEVFDDGEHDRTELYSVEELENMDDHEEENDLDDLEDPNFLLMSYADFLNRLCHTKFIPHKNVQEIAEEFLDKSLKSQATMEKKLRNCLKEVPNMPESKIEEIVNNVIGEDGFLAAQKELSSVYKREKFIKENFKFVPPCEVVLNKDSVLRGESKDVIHYIPVVQSFQHLMEEMMFLKMSAILLKIGMMS